jgi:hypothetical protein
MGSREGNAAESRTPTDGSGGSEGPKTGNDADQKSGKKDMHDTSPDERSGTIRMEPNRNSRV